MKITNNKIDRQPRYSANHKKWEKKAVLCCFLLFFYFPILAQPVATRDSVKMDSSVAGNLSHLQNQQKNSFIHQLGIELRPGIVLKTNDFLRGNTVDGKKYNNFFSAHLKYSFQFKPNTVADRVFRGTYQGIGLNYYDFGNQQKLGTPVSVYLFQGGQIARLNPKLTFNYEWNFGLSWNWKHYDTTTNPENSVIGSKANAYIDAAFYFKWLASRYIDVVAGLDFTHFSNGNTQIPNAGLNLLNLKLGLIYNFNREEDKQNTSAVDVSVPEFKKHITYDFVAFGSWRRKGVMYGDKKIASPFKYNVWGFNVSALYNLCYRFRTGLSLDGIYDMSAGVTTDDKIVSTGDDPKPRYLNPPWNKQLALGVSARGEFVMPYFAINFGIGVNVLHGNSDLESLYEILALKTDITSNLYLHIGYTLQNFHSPNYLMFGIGLRFNNRVAKIYR